MLCFYKLGTKCSVRLATLKVFVYHHHSPPPGLAAVFWRPSQKILMSQLYAKEKGFLYLILGTQHLKSTNIHFTIWYTNLKADSGRRIQGMLVFSFCKMGQSFACWQQEAASEGCRACWFIGTARIFMQKWFCTGSRAHCYSLHLMLPTSKGEDCSGKWDVQYWKEE